MRTWEVQLYDDETWKHFDQEHSDFVMYDLGYVFMVFLLWNEIKPIDIIIWLQLTTLPS